MFDAMADWMAVPLMQYEGGQPPRRIGLAHTSIAPYGVFKTADGVDILISIQSDREWRVLAAQVLGDAALAADPAFATNVARVKRRADTDAKVQAMFGATDADALTQKLAQADIAFARVNDTATLAAHPQLRRIEVATPVGAVSYPAPAARRDGAPRRYGAVPALGEHSDAIRAEFMPQAREVRVDRRGQHRSGLSPSLRGLDPAIHLLVEKCFAKRAWTLRVKPGCVTCHPVELRMRPSHLASALRCLVER